LFLGLARCFQVSGWATLALRTSRFTKPTDLTGESHPFPFDVPPPRVVVGKAALKVFHTECGRRRRRAIDIGLGPSFGLQRGLRVCAQKLVSSSLPSLRKIGQQLIVTRLSIPRGRRQALSFKFGCL
jgi:hypothetical protein